MPPPPPPPQYTHTQSSERWPATQEDKAIRKDRTKSTNTFGQWPVQPHFHSQRIISSHSLPLANQQKHKETTGSSYSLCRSQWRWRWQHLTGWFALSLFLTEVPCSHTTPHFAHLNHPGYELYAALSHVLHRTVVRLKALDGHNPKEDPTDAWWNRQSNRRNPQQ